MGGLVSNVVTEREQRISEMMKILGLPNWIFYSSWFIFYAITLAVSSLLVSLVMVFSDVAPDGNVFTVFIYYLLYSVSSIAFSLFLSSPFDSAKLAQTVGFLVYGLVSILGVKSLRCILLGTMALKGRAGIMWSLTTVLLQEFFSKEPKAS
jgi:ABC-type transport system involved in multi-copper enzyme maturation permease subunit